MTMRSKLPLFASALLMLSASPALAQDVTEANVRALYQETADAFKLPYDQYYKKIDSTTAANFIGITRLSLEMPGLPPVKQNLKKNKQQLLAEANQGHTAMKGAALQYEIKSIKIAPDNKSADVSNIMVIKNLAMPGAPTLVMDTVATCNDRVIAGTIVQLGASNCGIQTVIRKKT